MKRKVLWDFDGVLLDSFPDQFAWFSRVCSALGKEFPYSSVEEFRKDYREPVYPDMYTFLKFDWEGEKDRIWEEYHAHKRASAIDLVPGVEEVVRGLADEGDEQAIASSNTHDAITVQLERHGLLPFFRLIVGKNDLPHHNGTPLIKPHPACLLLGLERLDATPDDALYVGDSPSDIVACRRVTEAFPRPLPIVAYTGGYGFEKRLREEGERTRDAWPSRDLVAFASSPQEIGERIRAFR